MADKRIYLYDSSLRGGALPERGEFSGADKLAIAEALDCLGIDYVEAGQPGAGPTDSALFSAAPKYTHARLVVRPPLQTEGGSAAGDSALSRARDNGARIVCLTAAALAQQALAQLNVEARQHIDIIAENVSYAVGWVDEAMFVCGHFFDGFKADAHYALECAATAYIHGACWVVLSDDNGSTLPHEISEIVGEVARALASSHIGIRCLKDSDNAVAESLAAVRAGAHQVQGTFNGLGVRCGDVYPSLSDLRLVDYKVRILNSEGGTKARIRVMIDSTDGVDVWSTVGVSDNIIDASYSALNDGIVYKLLRDEVKRQASFGGSEMPDGDS